VGPAQADQPVLGVQIGGRAVVRRVREHVQGSADDRKCHERVWRETTRREVHPALHQENPKRRARVHPLVSKQEG
tara:strand:+ start:4169 stop:4393 length:225 start_codon:yes stop_codon:yes gene_type:complete